MTAGTDVEPRSKGLLTPSTPVGIVRRSPRGAAGAFVRHYWLPRWSLPTGAVVRQDVLEYPTTNLVIEPRSAVLFRAHRGLSSRTLDGSGWAFGVLLKPGVARDWVGASLRGMPVALPLERLRVSGAEAMADAVRERMVRADDEAAVAVFEAWLDGLPAPGDDAHLIERIVSAVESDRSLLRVEQLAERFRLNVRHLQRLVAGHIGFGPKWLIQRYRLQEAAAALRSPHPPALAALAAELGYADQAHFSREFRAVVGTTPGSYAAEAAPS